MVLASSIPNPFSAAAVSGGRLPFLFADPNAEKELLVKLDRHDWIGQIVGAHGSGKTTLTHHLSTQARGRFPSSVQVTIRGPSKIQRRVAGCGSPCLFVVDGVERLSRVDRWLFLAGFSFQALQRRREGEKDGLLVTGHRPLPRLPVVFETSFDEVLLNRLTGGILSTPIHNDIPDGDDDVFLGQQWKEISGALLQRHGDNCREIFMEMYDLYEANSGKNPFAKKTLPLLKAGVEN